MELMNKCALFGLCTLAVSTPMQGDARVELGRVGTQQLRIAAPEVAAQLVSVPFLKAAICRGRLQQVDLSASRVGAQAAAFAEIGSSRANHILRITDGGAAGAWFLVGEVNADGSAVEVIEDGFAGSLSDLQGDESFAVHPLYTLRELLPEEGDFLPAGAIDLQAMQVHFYAGDQFQKIWLSDGTLTEHVGWTTASAQGLQ